MIDVSRFKNNKIQVLNVRFGEEKQGFFNSIVFKRENNALVIIEKQDFKSLEEVVRGLNKKIPLLIHFCGKGILHKKVQGKEVSISNLIFNQNSEDFYFYEYKGEESTFVSFVRKNKINEILMCLVKKELFCLDFSVGPFVSAIINTDNKVLYSDSFELVFESDVLMEFLNSKNSLEQTNNIDDLSLKSFETSLFATAINYLYPNLKIRLTGSSILAKNKEEALYQKLFNRIGAFGLIFFLLSLLISFLLLNNYNKKYIEVQTKMIHFQDSYSKIETLNQDILDKEEILNNTGVYNNKFLSFYVNEITKNLSSEIVLSQLNIFPMSKTINKKKKISIDSNIISVTGHVNSSLNFNNWLKILKNRSWVLKIEIVDYKKIKNKNDEFKLLIKI